MDSAPKKLDAVDKWRARVLFRNPAPATDTWSKRMERQMAVLRVSFPFLTEKQLRGKAWTACGLRSLMGELPRSGLSPEVKKEFTKRGKDIRFTMSPKRKIKKEPIASEKTLENSSSINIMIPDSSEVSWEEVMKSKYPYCTQISKENLPILQSQFSHIYYTEKISECSTSTPSETNKNLSDLSMNLSVDHHYDPKPVEQCDILQQSQCHTPCTNEELQNSQKLNELFNVDSGSTFFYCNLPTAPENYWSNPMLNEEIVMSRSTSVTNEPTTEGSQNYNSINDIQTEDSSPLIFSQNYSLPLTPQEPSVNHPLLSNVCCEYSKACSKEEYKPVPYVNSNNIIRKLKEDFDKIIPSEVSLMKYFEAEEKTFKQIQSEVHEKVNTIILGLEEVESTDQLVK